MRQGWASTRRSSSKKRTAQRPVTAPVYASIGLRLATEPGSHHIRSSTMRNRKKVASARPGRQKKPATAAMATISASWAAGGVNMTAADSRASKAPPTPSSSH